MPVVTLLNEKGGVGKTTQAIHIAAGLAIKGHRVLLIDSDPQAHTTIQFRLKRFDGLLRLLAQDAEWNTVVFEQKEPIWHNGDAKGSLFVMPSHNNNRALPMMLSNPWALRERIDELSELDVVDIVVIDTSPTPSLLHSMIYMTTDWFIFPSSCASLSLDGLSQSALHWNQSNEERKNRQIDPSKLMGVIPTMFRKNTTSHEKNLAAIHKHFGSLTWEPVNMRTVWEQAADVRRTLFSYAPDDAATQEAWGVVNRVEEKMAYAKEAV